MQLPYDGRVKKVFLTVALFFFFGGVFPQKVFAENLSGPSSVDAFAPFVINASGLTIGSCYAYYINTSTEIVLPSSLGIAVSCYQGQDKHDIYYSSITGVTDNVFGIEGQKAGKYFIAIGGQRCSTCKFSPIKTIVVNVVVPPTATSAPTPTPGGPTLTPTPPTACNPPGTDPSTGKCLDNKCGKNPAGVCVLILVLPTSPLAGPTGTPIPSVTPIPHAFPCAKLVSGKCDAVATAVGEVPTDPGKFIAKLFLILLSMGGGWAVYLITTGGYHLMFSNGNPEDVKEAQEKITSAIVGLIFMILSLVILKVIGVDIFQLPTFTK